MSLPRALLIATLLCLAASADAGIMYKDAPDNGCAEEMDTEDCFGPTATAASGPTILTCQAIGSAGQHCRSCKEVYLSNGMYAGYKICAYVKRTAHCRCLYPGSDSCSNEGSCTYY